MKRLLASIKGLALLTIVNLSLFSTVYAVNIHEGGDPVKGAALFNANCASCHKITDEILAAPGLKGISDRWAGKDDLIVQWINNPQAANSKGDPYIKGLVDKYVGTYGWMAAQGVSREEINHILTYVKSGGGAGTGAKKDEGQKCLTVDDMAKLKAEEEEAKGSGSLIWIIIIGLILAIIGVSAASISRSLKAANKEGDSSEEEEHKGYWASVKAWMWKNKAFVGIAGLFLVCYFVVVGYGTLMDIGVYEGYNPEQPIWFSHASHVCKNEIDCQYCHSSASKSKHAGIPSVNVCMNCHKGINQGPISGTGEIAKIYAAIGFDVNTKQYIPNYAQKPIVWNKVHNLPDHVYFNHSQHVTVGKIDCKQCHGPVQTYTTGRQATTEEINLQEDVEGLVKLTKPTLTMGWCIECHKEKKIDLSTNGYYEEMHERFKSTEAGKRNLRALLQENIDGMKLGEVLDTLRPEISVKGMGGWECGKCHY
jgi:mono/diheme cytochrome c family protein